MSQKSSSLRPPNSEHELLTGRALADRIAHVCRGEDVQLAVAFWGKDAAVELFGSLARSKRASILCDVTLGGTQAKALEDMGAPNNKRLRHVRALHAKLYLSSRGCVIGSANASAAALGFAGAAPRHVEVGTYHQAHGQIWRAAKTWFEELYGPADRVDEDALARARLTWRPPPPSLSARPGSLLDAVRLNPERFRGIGFFFEKIPLIETDAKVERTASSAGARTTHERSIITDCSANDMFSGLTDAEVRDTPPLFIEFWRPDHRKLMIIGRRVEYRDHEHGTLYTSRQGRMVRRHVGDGMPALGAAARLDDDVTASILKPRKRGIRFLSPEALVAALS